MHSVSLISFWEHNFQELKHVIHKHVHATTWWHEIGFLLYNTTKTKFQNTENPASCLVLLTMFSEYAIRNADMLQKSKFYFQVFCNCEPHKNHSDLSLLHLQFLVWVWSFISIFQVWRIWKHYPDHLQNLHPCKKQSTYLICGFLLCSYPKYHTISSIFHSPSFTEPYKHGI